MAETWHQKSGKMTLIKFGFIFNLEIKKRIFRIMNFQKNLEMEMKKEYLRLYLL